MAGLNEEALLGRESTALSEDQPIFSFGIPCLSSEESQAMQELLRRDRVWNELISQQLLYHNNDKQQASAFVKDISVLEWKPM